MSHVPIFRISLISNGINFLRDALHDLISGLAALIIMGLGSTTAITLTGSWTFVVRRRWEKTVRDVRLAILGLHPRRLFGDLLILMRGIDPDLHADPLAGSSIYGFVINSGRSDWRGGHRIGFAYVDIGWAPTHRINKFALQSRRRPYAGIAMTA